ncbi:hypothetical protein [Pseudoalteromonas xiamenensis]
MIKNLFNKLFSSSTQEGIKTNDKDIDNFHKNNGLINSDRGVSIEESFNNKESILEKYFSSKILNIDERSFFLHGGFEDLNYSPMKDRPMWLALFENENKVEGFGYGKESSRRYVTKFTNKNKLKLLEFREINTAPIAKELKLHTSLDLDRALASYVKAKGVHGLIGPSNHVMLIDPVNVVEPIEFDNMKSDFLESLILKLGDGEINYSKRRISKGEIIKSDIITYKSLLDFDVLVFNQEEINQIEFQVLDLDDAIYHLARHIDLKPALIDNCLMGASWYEKMQFIEKSTDVA